MGASARSPPLSTQQTSHDGGWTLVEIERPHDKIFTTNDDFAARFTHAFGQVLDFQQWVDQHVAYARELMPAITVPRGLLVIGMRQALSPRQTTKLRQFSQSSRRIEIVTYDDLLARGRQLYTSLWHRHPPGDTVVIVDAGSAVCLSRAESEALDQFAVSRRRSRPPLPLEHEQSRRSQRVGFGRARRRR
jgi:hypothetical protein